MATALYVGTRNREYYEAHGLKPAQLVFAPHAIENERFMQDSGGLEAKAEAWRVSVGISPEQVVFLFAGKLEPKKAPEFLLKTFSQLRGSGPGLPVLVFCGSGLLEPALRQAAGPGVHFLGFRNQSEMPWVYRAGGCSGIALPGSRRNLGTRLERGYGLRPGGGGQ